MKNYLKLFRVKHYVKNLLIFLPILFSGNLLNKDLFTACLISFISFCLIASSVYVFNDIQDVEKDKLHPVKKNRPIASGKITIKKAYITFILLIISSLLIEFITYKINLISKDTFIKASLCLIFYLLLNIFYSKKGKHIPILDMIILSLGFLIRVYFGGFIIDAKISSWLYLTILSFSLYLVIGKRRGEFIKNKKSRPVLKYYSKEFLDKMMSIFLGLTIAFYSLWCIFGANVPNDPLLISIIILIFIIMKYSLIVEKDSLADPVDVLLSDKILIISSIFYVIYIGGVLYV